MKILLEDFYVNLTSQEPLRRVYSLIFANEEQLDGRYHSPLILSSGQFYRVEALQNPLSYSSNQIPSNVMKQRDIQKISFLGKMNQLSAKRILEDYWQNPSQQGLTDVTIRIVQLQEYLIHSST